MLLVVFLWPVLCELLIFFPPISDPCPPSPSGGERVSGPSLTPALHLPPGGGRVGGPSLTPALHLPQAVRESVAHL